jgi:hypothetical protein
MHEISIIFPIPGEAQVEVGHAAGIIKRKTGNDKSKTPPNGGVLHH